MREERREQVADDFAAVVGDADAVPDPGDALRRLDDVVALGFDSLVAEHQDAWAARWEDAIAGKSVSLIPQVLAPFPARREGQRHRAMDPQADVATYAGSSPVEMLIIDVAIRTASHLVALQTLAYLAGNIRLEGQTRASLPSETILHRSPEAFRHWVACPFATHDEDGGGACRYASRTRAKEMTIEFTG